MKLIALAVCVLLCACASAPQPVAAVCHPQPGQTLCAGGAAGDPSVWQKIKAVLP